METIQITNESEVTSVLGKIRSAILEGGYDDLASAASDLAGLIKSKTTTSNSRSESLLVKPLIAIADILAADRNYLLAAIATYGKAAHFSLARYEELNRHAVTKIITTAESLPTCEERIEAYQLAYQNAPALSRIATLAKYKKKEQNDAAYFKLSVPREKFRPDEAVVEADLKAVFGNVIGRVIRQQKPSGDIQYSIVVPRGFSRTKLSLAGVQGAQELQRRGVTDELDRIIVPANRFSQQTQHDVDFISRLQHFGIEIDASHGRHHDTAGLVTGYFFPERVNAERMQYMGIDAHLINPHEGNIYVPIERINIFADPSLIGKRNWCPAGDGNIKLLVKSEERPTVVKSLQTFGIAFCENEVSPKKDNYILIAKDDIEKLNRIIRQHVLKERSDNLHCFSVAIPSFANSIGSATYNSLFGFSHRMLCRNLQ